VPSNDTGWPGRQAAFAASAAWFGEVVTGAHGRWDEPGLGVWTIRDLVGHTSRSLITVDSYLDSPAEEISVDSAAAYFAGVFAAAGDPAAIAQRGRDAGAALGADPVAAVAGLVTRVVDRVQGLDGSDTLTCPLGGIRLADYLPTRTFELTVHTLDLAKCLGGSVEPPALSTAATWALLGDLMAENAEMPGVVIPALLGRGPLPDSFSVLGDR
jgi:Mycothiol maleylpyruvate isomerase N-terminal domain